MREIEKEVIQEISSPEKRVKMDSSHEDTKDEVMEEEKHPDEPQARLDNEDVEMSEEDQREKVDFHVKLNTNLIRAYGSDILRHHLKNQKTIKNPLRNHDIESRMRVRMVCWF